MFYDGMKNREAKQEKFFFPLFLPSYFIQNPIIFGENAGDIASDLSFEEKCKKLSK